MISIVTDNNNNLTKEYYLENGKLLKKTAAQLYSGEAEHLDFENLKELDAILDNLKPNQAIALGVCEQRKVDIVSKKELGNNPDAVARSKDYFKFNNTNVILFDIDNNSTVEEAMNSLFELDDRLKDAEILVRYGTSSFIKDTTTDTFLNEHTSLHIYVAVDGIEDLSGYVEDLKSIAWIKGLADFKISKDGKRLEDYFFDRSVFSPERLIFEAGSICAEPLIQEKPASYYQAGMPLRLRRLSYDSVEADKVRNKKQKEANLLAKEVKAAYRTEKGLELRERGLSDSEIVKVFKGLDNDILTYHHIVYDMQGNAIRCGEISKEHDRLDIQDPIEPNGLQKAMIFWNDGKPKIHSYDKGGRVFTIELDFKAIARTRKKELGYDVAENGKILPTKQSLRTLLSENNVDFKYDLIKKNVIIEVDDIDNSSYAVNKEQAGLQHVRDLALKNDIPTTIVDALPALVNEVDYQYNPLMDFVKDSHLAFAEAPADYVGQLCDTLVVEPGIESVKRQLVVKWLIQCVAAWDYEKMATNNQRTDASYGNVLVFQGNQGIRKTTWFKNLLPRELMDDYFNEGSMLNPMDKDSVRQNTCYAIAELGELDSTINKADVGSLKAFLSKTKDEYRLPYERKTEMHRRSVSFCASVNDGVFLRDGSGNRRFWVLPIKAINYDKFKTIPKNLLWGQIFDMYIGNKSWWLEEGSLLFKQMQEINKEFETYSPAHEVLAYITESAKQNAPMQRKSVAKMFSDLGINTSKADKDVLTTKLLQANYHRNPDKTFRVPFAFQLNSSSTHLSAPALP